MNARLVALATFASGLTACMAGSFLSPGPLPPCQTVADCAPGYACFREGCAKPFLELAIEVKPATSGLAAQDQSLAQVDGPRYDVPLRRNATIKFEMKQGSPSTGYERYEGPYSITASGPAIATPTINRSFTAEPTQVSHEQNGIVVSPAVYRLDVVTTNPLIPPHRDIVKVSAGEQVAAEILLPQTCVARYRNVLVRTRTSPVLPDAVSVLAVSDAGLPISKAVAVNPDPNSSLQILDLCLSEGRPFELLVSPKDASSLANADKLMPSKRFSVANFAPKDPLEIGDYGAPVPFQGQVFKPANSKTGRAAQPLAGATVWLQGRVNGQGEFRSAQVTTGGNGEFALLALPGERLSGGQRSSHSLVIDPSAYPDNTMAATVIGVEVGESAITAARFECKEKIAVRGTVVGPGRVPARSVAVTATAIVDPMAVLSFAEGATDVTDANGAYVLYLNEGAYRFSFAPPRASPYDQPVGRGFLGARRIDANTQQMPDAVLPAAVTVDGKLIPPPDAKASAAANAVVEVYLADPRDPSSVLLVDKTQANSNSEFRLVLPVVE